jgi:glycerol-3-phosphate O-acyltransferase 3/4
VSGTRHPISQREIDPSTEFAEIQEKAEHEFVSAVKSQLRSFSFDPQQQRSSSSLPTYQQEKAEPPGELGQVLHVEKDGQAGSGLLQAASGTPATTAAAAAEKRQQLLPVMLGGIAPLLTDAAAAIVDDSFWCCFRPVDRDTITSWWNTWYLSLLWYIGVWIRYCILLPIRVAIVVMGYSLLWPPIFLLQRIAPKFSQQQQPQQAQTRPDPQQQQQQSLSKPPVILQFQQLLVSAMCRVWLTAFTAAVRYHGPEPSFAPGQVWVANHTSMIDYHILAARHPFACLMQQQPGALGFVQRHVWSTVGCIYFERQGGKGGNVLDQMKAHVHTPGNTPLLVFPEGVCSNNRYCLLFKRGAFSLGATVCPVAIKYNKSLSDTFWHKGETFIMYMLRLLKSWAVVADVTFLPPQQQQPGENVDDFAERVRVMIAARAGLKPVPWDGMLKYYQLGPRRPALLQLRHAVAAQVAAGLLGRPLTGPGAAEAAAALAAALKAPEAEEGGFDGPVGQDGRGQGGGSDVRANRQAAQSLAAAARVAGSTGASGPQKRHAANTNAAAAGSGGIGKSSSSSSVRESVAAALSDGRRVEWDWGAHLAGPGGKGEGKSSRSTNSQAGDKKQE